MRIIALAAAFFLSAPFAAQAATLTSVDRATFAAAVAGGNIDSENFDFIAVATILNTLNNVTYSASGGEVIVTNEFLTSTGQNGIGSTSADSSTLGFFLSNETATFTFANPITAFAIDINTFATTNGSYRATLNIGDTIDSIFETFPGNNTGQFIGFISDTPFTSLTLAAISGFSYTLDTLVYGDAADVTPVIPIPGAIPLFLTGLAMFGFRRKRAR